MIPLKNANFWQVAEFNSVVNRVRWLEPNEERKDESEIHLTYFQCVRRSDRKIVVEDLKYRVTVVFPPQMFPDKAIILVANMLFEMETAE